jgi:hypothetical protein
VFAQTSALKLARSGALFSASYCCSMERGFPSWPSGVVPTVPTVPEATSTCEKLVIMRDAQKFRVPRDSRTAEGEAETRGGGVSVDLACQGPCHWRAISPGKVGSTEAT